MKAKGYLILTNWLIVIILILALWLVINMVVSASYHPNGALAPYYAVAPQIWGMFIVTSLILEIIISLFRDRLSAKGIGLTMTGAYGILIIISAISLLQVKPVPDYFRQSVGNIEYRVPREFTSIQNNQSGVRLSLCIETLKGIYSRNRNNCKYNEVSLSPNSSDYWQKGQYFRLSSFFKNSKEFNFDGNKVLVSKEAAKYQSQAINGLKIYTISEPELSKSVIIHLQINEQNELIRFVRYREFKNSKNERSLWQHWVKTPQGILQYELYESGANKDFKLERWQQIDRNLLNLISEWKIN